jgi:hypothetical protein
MKTTQWSLFFIIILLSIPAQAVAAGTETASSFVQATILRSNPAGATLTFLDASGRQRVERATGEAILALSTVRPGDHAILSLSTDAGGSFVTKVRVHRAAPPTVAAATAGDPSAAKPSEATPAVASGGSMPLKRRWPNPYANGTQPQPDRP